MDDMRLLIRGAMLYKRALQRIKIAPTSPMDLVRYTRTPEGKLVAVYYVPGICDIGMRFAVTLHNDTLGTYIAVDDFFMDSPYNVRKFIIMHEWWYADRTHALSLTEKARFLIELGELKTDNMAQVVKAISPQRSRFRELEADRLVVEHLGLTKVVESLQYIYLWDTTELVAMRYQELTGKRPWDPMADLFQK